MEREWRDEDEDENKDKDKEGMRMRKGEGVRAVDARADGGKGTWRVC